MWETVTEAGGFHAHASNRTAQSNGLKLRYDEGHEAMGQGGIHEVLIGAHALHIGRAGNWIDLNDAAKAGYVEAFLRLAAATEEIGGLLG